MMCASLRTRVSPAIRGTPGCGDGVVLLARWVPEAGTARLLGGIVSAQR